MQGLLLGALAIYSEDPTGTAAQVLPDTIANSQQYCAQAISSDGTWLETPDYWSVTVMLSPSVCSRYPQVFWDPVICANCGRSHIVQLAPTNKLSLRIRP